MQGQAIGPLTTLLALSLSVGALASAAQTMDQGMTHPDEREAWRLFCLNWIVLGLMGLTLALSLAFTRFSIDPFSALKPFAIVAAYTAVAYRNLYRSNGHDARIVFILGSTAQVLLIPILMTPMTYIVQTFNLPYQDMLFQRMDEALGLDWVGYYNFVNSHLVLAYAEGLGYAMIGWPIFAIPIVLGWTGRYRRLQEFTLAFAIALVVTTIVAGLLPARGTYVLLNVTPDPNGVVPGSYLHQLPIIPQLRDGTLRALAFSRLEGIITFPSFHAALAALYLWALWDVRWMRPLALLANVAMLMATPLFGGHYFVDVFAGIAMTAIGVISARWIANALLAHAGTQSEPDYRAAAAVPAE